MTHEAKYNDKSWQFITIHASIAEDRIEFFDTKNPFTECKCTLTIWHSQQTHFDDDAFRISDRKKEQWV